METNEQEKNAAWRHEFINRTWLKNGWVDGGMQLPQMAGGAGPRAAPRPTFMLFLNSPQRPGRSHPHLGGLVGQQGTAQRLDSRMVLDFSQGPRGLGPDTSVGVVEGPEREPVAEDDVDEDAGETDPGADEV